MKKTFILLSFVFLMSGCGKNVSDEEIIVGENTNDIQENLYEPSFEGSPNLTIELNGDYTINFNVNNEGTIYYMIQPWYEVITYDVSPSDIENGIGQEFILIADDGEFEEDPIYVVSAKSIEVSNHEEEVIQTGYMGDITGVVPSNDEIQFTYVVWYVFKDIDGNYSNVQMLSKR